MENLHDVAGVRIICEYLADVYKVRDNLLADGFMELLREKDYIKTPKPNGYRSLHLIVAVPVPFQAGVQKVICELQLRTTAMGTRAALEHSLPYKKDRPCGPEIDCELLECADMLSETDVKMQKIAEQLNMSYKRWWAGASYPFSTKCKSIERHCHTTAKEKKPSYSTIRHTQKRLPLRNRRPPFLYLPAADRRQPL